MMAQRLPRERAVIHGYAIRADDPGSIMTGRHLMMGAPASETATCSRRRAIPWSDSLPVLPPQGARTCPAPDVDVDLVGESPGERRPRDLKWTGMMESEWTPTVGKKTSYSIRHPRSEGQEASTAV